MVLGRKDLSLRPTQSGFLFLGILIAMLLGSVNYNNNAGFLLVFLLGTMAVISLFHSFQNLVGLDISPMHVHPVFMGQSIIFSVSIKGGNSPGQSSGQTPGQTLFIGFKETDPRPFSGRGVLKLSIPSQKRGYHVPGNLMLESVYPFGLFRLKASLPFPGRGLVYPAPLSEKIPPARAGEKEEGGKKSQNTGPDDFQGLKPYLPGNPMGRISWKTFSRGQGLFVKEFTADKGQDILMDLNLIRGRDIEKKLSLICGSLLDAEKKQGRYGIRLGPLFIKPGKGQDHLHRCLRALALYGPAEAAK